MQTIKNKHFAGNLKKIVSPFIYCLLLFNNCDCNGNNAENHKLYNPGITLVQDRDLISKNEEDEFEKLCSDYFNEEEKSLAANQITENNKITNRITEIFKEMNAKYEKLIDKYKAPENDDYKAFFTKELFEKIRLPYLKKNIEMVKKLPTLMPCEIRDKKGVIKGEYTQKEFVSYYEQHLEEEKKQIYG